MLFRFPARRRIIFSRGRTMKGVKSRRNRRPRSGSLDDLIHAADSRRNRPGRFEHPSAIPRKLPPSHRLPPKMTVSTPALDGLRMRVSILRPKAAV
ncbi:hypothetical protein RPHASCH2410_CH01750 [Rhizobium phaseoli Ch24-10]|nr:hypothetical protein RPHASCH2410_CH01750 [Rhizobium phaseoli Ch24-10]